MYCPRARLLAGHLPASRKDLTAVRDLAPSWPVINSPSRHLSVLASEPRCQCSPRNFLSSPSAAPTRG